MFNVGADVPFTVNHLARIVAEAMGRKREIRYLEARNEVKVAFPDHWKADRVFGGRPKNSSRRHRGHGGLGHQARSP